MPADLKAIEDFSALLISLGMVVNKGNDVFSFKISEVDDVAQEIVLFALIRLKGEDRTVSFDILQRISLIFGLPMTSLIEIIRSIESMFPNTLIFTDNSGVKNVQFLRNIEETEALNHYYKSL